MARTKKRSPGNKSPNKKVVPTKARIEPPYSLRFNKRTKKIEFKCTLHKVPPQFIEFDPTPTRLVLHTKKYSKHFYIDVPYPHNVTVAADDSTEAQLENGILSATFNIISEMPEIPETAKVLGKRQKTEKPEESTEAPPTKRKKIAPKKVVGKKASKVAPVPLASTSDSESEETDETPKKKTKTFVSKETSLEMIDAISTKVEGVITAKLEKENSKMEWQAERKEVREKRKQNRQEKKKEERQAILNIIEEQEKDKKTKKKKGGAPISLPVPDFAENEKNDENDEKKIKGILKSPHSSKTNNSVSFSPTLCHVKAIPRVKSPAFQKREMMASLQQQKRKKNKKSKLRSKRR